MINQSIFLVLHGTNHNKSQVIIQVFGFNVVIHFGIVVDVVVGKVEFQAIQVDFLFICPRISNHKIVQQIFLVSKLTTKLIVNCILIEQFFVLNFLVDVAHFHQFLVIG